MFVLAVHVGLMMLLLWLLKGLLHLLHLVLADAYRSRPSGDLTGRLELSLVSWPQRNQTLGCWGFNAGSAPNKFSPKSSVSNW